VEINFPENFDPLSLRIMLGILEFHLCPTLGWLNWELERKTKLPVKQKLKSQECVCGGETDNLINFSRERKLVWNKLFQINP